MFSLILIRGISVKQFNAFEDTSRGSKRIKNSYSTIGTLISDRNSKLKKAQN